MSTECIHFLHVTCEMRVEVHVRVQCRKRKLFAQQDLPQLLQKEGLNHETQSRFKLDIFDDTEFESRLGSQWVPKTPGSSSGMLV